VRAAGSVWNWFSPYWLLTGHSAADIAPSLYAATRPDSPAASVRC
jgi:hypothetical protein